ncbi:hypothetical protein QC764_0037680 [Podospora pseudoanserina]|uniref:Uncharacterized protein n=1 Tax=Podospora pseudoanserina TaxID=2609844 RepID=A0ABR0IHE7_9PEZI|nr:hypothetical protein QC764_0037680 [Podospora pseudoanserina]
MSQPQVSLSQKLSRIIRETDLPELITSPSTFTMPTMTLASFRSNFTFGFAHGLIVPFALTAGLSSLGIPAK